MSPMLSSLNACMLAYTFYESDGRVIRYAKALAELGAVLTRRQAYRHLKPVFDEGAGTLIKPLTWQGDMSFGPPRDGQHTFQRLDVNPRWSGIPDLEPLPQPVQLDRHVLVGSFGRCHEHLDVRYAAVAPEGAAAVVSDESHDVRWWPVGAMPDVEDEMRELVSLARERLAQSTSSPVSSSPATSSRVSS